MRVGRQVAEAARLGGTRIGVVKTHVKELLSEVQLDAAKVARTYPFELSGGQRQRVLIAIAIAARPKLLIADEPTTALDVTVQKGILDLLVELSVRHTMGLLFISHDLGVVNRVANDVAVMYAGGMMEVGPAQTVLHRPRHRYTSALLRANPTALWSTPTGLQSDGKLFTIPGSVESVNGTAPGCRFLARCEDRVEDCRQSVSPTTTGNHTFWCCNPLANIEDPPR